MGILVLGSFDVVEFDQFAEEADSGFDITPEIRISHIFFVVVVDQPQRRQKHDLFGVGYFDGFHGVVVLDIEAPKDVQ